MQPNSSPTVPPKVAGRLVLGAVLIAILVFGIELTLSTLRTRNLSVSINTELRFSPTPFPPEIPTRTPTATLDPRKTPPSETPTPSIPFIAAGDAMVVNVKWDYRIGPRFQQVTIRAGAYIPDRDTPVAEGTAAIDCGSQVLSCSGTVTIPLNYVIPDAGAPNGQRAIPWPVGEYTLRVEQSQGGLKYTEINRSIFRVQPQ